jgi:RNA polymerase sigma-70 factor (ECF subfamily)
MPDRHEFAKLIAESVSGNRVSLQRLLLSQYIAIAQHVECRMPRQAEVPFDADDILQETVVRVIRHIGRCTANTEASFRAWLKKIAENCIQDEIRRAKSEKRGGKHTRAAPRASALESSIGDVVDLLSAGSHTPSRSAARHEAIAAVRMSIEALPTEYRRAVELRLLKGKSLDETAAVLGCSPRAVQGLVDRAKKKMRADLARLASNG